ncbi:hypothetical protein Hanom_Chr05g00431651 [Helianthus anomalus]
MRFLIRYKVITRLIFYLSKFRIIRCYLNYRVFLEEPDPVAVLIGPLLFSYLLLLAMPAKQINFKTKQANLQ